MPHDGVPCYGFYITIAGHRILYATDYLHLPPSFKTMRVTVMIVECNYQKEYLNKESPKYDHQLKGHCSLDALIEKVIKENMTSDLRTVILCHLSGDSCNAEECLSEVQKVVGEGVKCLCSVAGETVELSLFPF